jgi:hypothetical protein
MNYVIRSIDDQDRYEYWSNDFGWVSLSIADQFTPEEQKTLNLPMGGEWVPYSQIISQLDESKKNHPTYQRRTDLSVAGDE